MKLYDVTQGSEEWVRLRLGIPTASEMDRIFTPGGKPSGKLTQEKYMMGLLAERITGLCDTDFKSSWMERGTDTESEARNFYDLQRGLDVKQIGFVTNDAGTIGVSPDALVGDPGLMEIKCPKAGVHIGYLLKSGSAYAEYKVQVQGQLWITERQWCDVISYHPAMPMALNRIERDEEFIKGLSAAVEAFSEALEAAALQLVEKGWIHV